MTFLAPARLALLAIPLVALIAYLVVQSMRQRYAVRYTNLDLLDKVAPDRPGWRRHLTASVLLIGLVVVALAASRPAMAVQVPQEQATVVLAVDTSLSMDAADVDPSRIKAAQDAAREFVSLAPEDLRIGVVSFAGTANAVLTPTADRDAALRAVDSLRLGEGTAVGEGIYTSLGVLEATSLEYPEAPGAIVVMSDGETTTGRPDINAAEAAAAEGIPVWTVSFGTPNGEIFLQGDTIAVPVNAGALERVAEATGGEFFSAASSAELTSILDAVGSEVGFEEEQREVTDWFAIAGLFALALAAAGSLFWAQRLP